MLCLAGSSRARVEREILGDSLLPSGHYSSGKAAPCAYAPASLRLCRYGTLLALEKLDFWRVFDFFHGNVWTPGSLFQTGQKIVRARS
jgi:hypothetical protein